MKTTHPISEQKTTTSSAKEMEAEFMVEQDSTWELLAHASTQEPSEVFTQNVMRSVRQLEQTPQNASSWNGLFSFFSGKTGWASVGFAALALGLLAFLQPSSEPNTKQNLVQSPQNQNSSQPAQAILTKDTEPAILTETSELAIYLEDDELAKEMLIAFAESPEALSADELEKLLGI